MSFDSTTRNKLAKFVSEARSLLVVEFGEQLQEVYGIRMDGTVLPLEKLAHLTDTERAKASLLREQIEHILSGTAGTVRSNEAEAVDRIIREQAFTLFNRFCALRMAEERDLVQECVGGGFQSKGFRVFETVARTGLGGTYDRYKAFLYSLFDEISVDLGVLFDRFSSMGLLFPRENALKTLFKLLNNFELKLRWSEDETIGWIYQYWNSKEERKAMRDASQAPRNSRELAVRNQFFTPRYVVEFLTDNTLGRIWYEMRKGDTVLKGDCRYLVRRPNEIFLALGEKAPVVQENEVDLSQEELLKQPVYIEHLPKKDPRDLRVLDPACGSGHFLLYAFDLLERIYEEAWEDPESSESEITRRTLREEFEIIEELRRTLPKLIIERNLHGIDIDPRAVQIAALALWLRAQKTWKNLGIKAAERPQVAKSNIVTAEPMPGEEEPHHEFTAGLKPLVLGQLVDVVFDKMRLAGEAGSLLKIEEEIKDAVANARKQWLEGPKPDQQLLFPHMADPRPKQQELRFNFKGVTDERFWEQAEDRILDALKDYAERAENGHAIGRRLFAEDAARGFAFIDLCRKRYNVVLMNPPFGSWPVNFKAKAKSVYPASHSDILAAFVDRGGQLLRPSGKIGAITSRTCFFLSSFTRWRENVVLDLLQPLLLADLGHGVMDSAMVEAAAYVLSRPPARDRTKLHCFQLVEESAPDNSLFDAVEAVRSGRAISGVFTVDPASFRQIPNAPFAYWVSNQILRLFTELPAFEDEGRVAKIGMSTSDDVRFLRCKWEIDLRLNNKKILQWRPFAKGGIHSGFYSDIHLMVLWASEGAEIKAWVVSNPNDPRTVHWSRRIANSEFFFQPGLTWPLRTTSKLSLRAMPAGCIFGHKGPAAFVKGENREELLALLSIMNSSVFSSLVMLQLAAADAAARSYEVGVIQRTPVPRLTISEKGILAGYATRAWALKRSLDTCTENSHAFMLPGLLQVKATDLIERSERWLQIRRSTEEEITKIRRNIDSFCLSSYLSDNSEHQTIKTNTEPDAGVVSVSGKLENGYGEHSSIAVDVFTQVIGLFGYFIGTAFGRWDVRIALDTSLAPKLPDPFDPLPVCSPGMLVGPDGLPAKSDLIVSEEWLRVRPGANTFPPEGTVKNLTIPDSDYPLRVTWDGILLDDPGFNGGQPHRDDIVRRVREVLDLLWKEKAHAIEQEACDILGVTDLRYYFRKPTGFFQDHLKRYSKSRRQAPIYWPLSTESGSYTLWIYYHRLDDQILFKCVRIVELKIKEVRDDIDQLKKEMGDSGNREQRDGLEKLQDFYQELVDFRGELLRVAKFYRPDLNDGVIINAAPLWKVSRLKKWQKSCKDCWDKLEAGEYDWSHMALNLHPDQVREKCKSDKSLAIAHGFEELYIESENPKRKKRKE